MKQTLAELRRSLAYHPPMTEHHERLETGRKALLDAGVKLCARVPESKALSEALDHLNLAYHWYRQAVEEAG